jgi:hypothetical protein
LRTIVSAPNDDDFLRWVGLNPQSSEAAQQLLVTTDRAYGDGERRREAANWSRVRVERLRQNG